MSTKGVLTCTTLKFNVVTARFSLLSLSFSYTLVPLFECNPVSDFDVDADPGFLVNVTIPCQASTLRTVC